MTVEDADVEARRFVDALTVQQVEDTITEALRRGDIEMVPSLIKVLATKDARRAELVLDTLKLGLALAAEERAS